MNYPKGLLLRMAIAAAIYFAAAFTCIKLNQPDPLGIGAFLILTLNGLAGVTGGVVITIIGAIRKKYLDSVVFFIFLFSNITSAVMVFPAMMKEHTWLISLYTMAPLLTATAQLYYLVMWLNRRKELKEERSRQ